MDDKVSIIIPMYNAEKSVKRCLESALSQTYKNIELICVNDGSEDNTARIVDSISRLDSRVLLISKENGGVSSARNLGIKRATGYYIQFLDVDDALEKNATARMVKEMTSKRLDIVMCGYHSVNKPIDVSLPEKKLERNELIENFTQLYQSTYLNPPWNKMYIRENIKYQFPTDMSLGEDLIFNLEYLKNAKNIEVIPDEIYIYTVGQPNSLTAKYHSNALECLEKKIECILDFLISNGQENFPDALVNDFWKDYKHCIDGMIACGQFNTEQLKIIFSKMRSTHMWNMCFSDFTPDEKQSIIFWEKKYDRYITDIRRKSKVQNAKQGIKKLLNRLKENS